MRSELDRVETQLKPGTGRIEFGAIGSGDFVSGGRLGGYIEAEGRITDRASVFSRGEAWREWGKTTGWGWSWLAGGRFWF